jgi:hypothetical protein
VTTATIATSLPTTDQELRTRGSYTDVGAVRNDDQRTTS